MAEPSSSGTGLVALAIAALGPTFGEYGLIVFAALGGSLWALGRREAAAPIVGARFLLKIVVSAVLLTGFIAAALERYTSLSAPQWLAPVAFAIGFFGDNWSNMGQSIVDAIRNFLINRSGGTPK